MTHSELVDSFVALDRSPLPILGCYGSTGSRRGLPRLVVWRHQFGRHPCQACDDPTQGSCSRSQTEGRTIIVILLVWGLVSIIIIVHVLYFILVFLLFSSRYSYVLDISDGTWITFFFYPILPRRLAWFRKEISLSVSVSVRLWLSKSCLEGIFILL